MNTLPDHLRLVYPDRNGFASSYWFPVIDAARFREAMKPYMVTVWSEVDAKGVERFALSSETPDGDWPDVSEHADVDLEIGFPLVVAPHLPPGAVAAFYAAFQELEPMRCPRVGGYCIVVDQNGLRAGSRLDDAFLLNLERPLGAEPVDSFS